MFDTQLEMSFVAFFAGKLGCFLFIDLEILLLLAEDPMHDGYNVNGGVYIFFKNHRQDDTLLKWLW